MISGDLLLLAVDLLLLLDIWEEQSLEKIMSGFPFPSALTSPNLVSLRVYPTKST